MAHENLIEFEDSGVASIEMANGMIGGLNWSLNAYQENMEVSLTVLSEKGSIRLAGEQLNAVEYQLLANGKLTETIEPGAGEDYIHGKGPVDNYDIVYESMVKALQDSAYANSYDGLKTVEAIEKIYKSLAG